MFSASITCSSCGIICEQALNRINERNLIIEKAQDARIPNPHARCACQRAI
jgi:hypothetical protein